MVLQGHRTLVKERLPRTARDVLERGTLCYLAVRTSHGPHLTPVVYVLDGGRLWLTTSRTSVKARALRRERDVGGMIRSGDEAVSFRGRARTYDALDPLSWPFAAAAGPRLVRAATRFSLKNARFFAGYAADARRVPLAWTPPGRVFVGVEMTSGAVLDLGRATVTSTWGGFGTEPQAIEYRRSIRPLRSHRALDLGVPRSIRSVVGNGGEGTLAIARGGATVAPVRWRRVAREGTYQATLPQAFLDLAGAAAPERPGEDTRAALTVDRLASWRAAEMAGLLVQGEADAFVRAPTPHSDLALVRLRPRRVVWWQGWSSGLVTEE
jgi:hypothetical protein